MKREVAREKMYKILFQMGFHDDFETRYISLLDEEDLRGVQREYVRESIQGILDNIEDIDSIIKEKIIDIEFSRLSTQVLICLRLGIYEIIYNDSIPPKIALNEAVKIAGIYADEKEVSFVNGVLHSVYMEKKGEENE